MWVRPSPLVAKPIVCYRAQPESERGKSGKHNKYRKHGWQLCCCSLGLPERADGSVSFIPHWCGLLTKWQCRAQVTISSGFLNCCLLQCGARTTRRKGYSYCFPSTKNFCIARDHHGDKNLVYIPAHNGLASVASISQSDLYGSNNASQG